MLLTSTRQWLGFAKCVVRSQSLVGIDRTLCVNHIAQSDQIFNPIKMGKFALGVCGL